MGRSTDDGSRSNTIVPTGLADWNEDAPATILALSSSMMAYWDRDLVCRYANPAYEVWFGVRPDSLIGSRLRDLLGPCLFAANESPIRAALAGTAQVFDRAVPHRDGTVRHGLAHYTPHVENGEVIGLVVQVTDVTSLHELRNALQAEAARAKDTARRLRSSEAALRQAQQLGQIGSWEWEFDGGAIRWSDQLYAIFERDSSQPPPSFAEHSGMLAPPSWISLQAAVEAACGTGKSYALELEYVRRNGSTGWVETRGAVEFDEDRRIVGMFGTVQEVSARHEAANATSREKYLKNALETIQSQAEQIKELARELAQARRAEMLGTMVGGIAHDFNNVLAAVSGSFNLLDRRAQDPKSEDLIRRGKRGVDRAAQLVRQLMSFTRPQLSEATSVDLAQLATDCRDLLKLAAGPRIELDVQTAAGCHAFVDACQLEIALINLVVNARDAMANGGIVSLCVLDHAATRLLAANCSADSVAICVRDAGTGMTPEVLARAKTPFFSTKEAGQGTGLGLAMVHQFAQHAGGSLELLSTPGEGTSAVIVLPGVRSGTSPLPCVTSGTESHLHGNATILVVEDDALVRAVIVQYLEELGYVVLQADDAGQALKVCMSAQALDLVVMDVALPHADGVELAGEFRAMRPELPKLLITGQLDRLTFEGKAVLRKPFTPGALADRVLDLLGRRGQAIATLTDRIRDPALRALYETWRGSKENDALPSVESLRLEGRHAFDSMFVAEVTSRVSFKFRRTHLGKTLKAKLELLFGADGLGTKDERAFGGLEGAYARCFNRREPQYEYLRARRPDGGRMVFERLLLPCSDAKQGTDYVVGMVKLENL